MESVLPIKLPDYVVAISSATNVPD